MARISTKEQVTVPKAVRDRLGAKQGDFLPFEQKSLSDLSGALGASRPFPGKTAVRKQVGKKLGARRR